VKVEARANDDYSTYCREAEWNYNKGKELGMPNQAAHPDMIRLMNLVPWDMIEEF